MNYGWIYRRSPDIWTWSFLWKKKNNELLTIWLIWKAHVSHYLPMENFLNEKNVLECATRGRQSSRNLPETVQNITRKVYLCNIIWNILHQSTWKCLVLFSTRSLVTMRKPKIFQELTTIREIKCNLVCILGNHTAVENHHLKLNNMNRKYITY